MQVLFYSDGSRPGGSAYEATPVSEHIGPHAFRIDFLASTAPYAPPAGTEYVTRRRAAPSLTGLSCVCVYIYMYTYTHTHSLSLSHTHTRHAPPRGSLADWSEHRRETAAALPACSATLLVRPRRPRPRRRRGDGGVVTACGKLGTRHRRGGAGACAAAAGGESTAAAARGRGHPQEAGEPGRESTPRAGACAAAVGG